MTHTEIERTEFKKFKHIPKFKCFTRVIYTGKQRIKGTGIIHEVYQTKSGRIYYGVLFGKCTGLFFEDELEHRKAAEK